jgi:hypothetical protein
MPCSINGSEYALGYRGWAEIEAESVAFLVHSAASIDGVTGPDSRRSAFSDGKSARTYRSTSNDPTANKKITRDNKKGATPIRKETPMGPVGAT